MKPGKIAESLVTVGDQKTAQQEFVFRFRQLAFLCNEIAREKGWWNNDRPFSEGIALMHSELSEALEGDRMGNPPDDKIPTFTAVEAELADTIIRIMDWSEEKNLRVAEAIVAKMLFNRNRPFKHGGKKF